MRDPYVILGVPKTASAAEIKKAFRGLAKAFHPDQSKDPRAKERFSEANSAYEILGDEKKRAAFDRGEIDAEGKPRAPQYAGGFSGNPGRRASGAQPGFEHFEFNFGGSPFGRGGPNLNNADIFADLFGGAGPGAAGMGANPGRAQARGADVQAEVTISLAESVRGTRTRVTLPGGRVLDVAVPAGIAAGQQIRLKGQGQTSPRGAEAGDALITIRVASHPSLKVEGRDLRLDLPVTLYEAVLGGKVTAPTLDGSVELTLPPNSSGTKILRLRGKGLPAQGNLPAGDLLVAPRIVLPDSPGSELTKLMHEWVEDKAYMPRDGLL